MKRRSFLTLLSLSPVVARAAPGDPPFDTLSDWRTMSDGNDSFRRVMREIPFAEFSLDSRLAYNTAPRTREGNGG